MSSDTVLRALLQKLHSPESGVLLLPTAASLLTHLTNPRNTTLLTTQLLTASAFWRTADPELRVCHRFIGTFQSAALGIVKRDETFAHGVERVQWTNAVVRGISAAHDAPRWKHVLALAGLLLGFSVNTHIYVAADIKGDIEAAFVRATNLALEEEAGRESIASASIALALGLTFPIVGEQFRRQVNAERALPVVSQAVFFAFSGLEGGEWAATLDRDFAPNNSGKPSWPAGSPVLETLQSLLSRPLVLSMGPLSHLLSHNVQVAQTETVMTFVEKLLAFSASLKGCFRATNVCSEPLPTLNPLWNLFRPILFSTVTVLRALLSRVLNDRRLSGPNTAPILAKKALQTLHNLSFISHPLGRSSLTAEMFVTLSAIDVLANFPGDVPQLLSLLAPSSPEGALLHPMDATLFQHFLSTAEHFTSVAHPSVVTTLLIPATNPLLHPSAPISESGLDRDLFETAHSVVLAVLATPQNAPLAGEILPAYLNTVLDTFPSHLSSRQYKLALRTLVRLVSPPHVLSTREPPMASTIMQILRERVEASNFRDVDTLFAMIESLPHLSISELSFWLEDVSELVDRMTAQFGGFDSGDAATVEEVRARFWNVLSDGAMDVRRAEVCVHWWARRGRFEFLSARDAPEPPLPTG